MDCRDGWVAHRAFWSNNPMLVRRMFLAAHPWPAKPDSEAWFGKQLFDTDPRLLVGMWGGYDDPPQVTHIGHTRAGAGY